MQGSACMQEKDRRGRERERDRRDRERERARTKAGQREKRRGRKTRTHAKPDLASSDGSVLPASKEKEGESTRAGPQKRRRKRREREGGRQRAKKHRNPENYSREKPRGVLYPIAKTLRTVNKPSTAKRSITEPELFPQNPSCKRP